LGLGLGLGLQKINSHFNPLLREAILYSEKQLTCKEWSVSSRRPAICLIRIFSLFKVEARYGHLDTAFSNDVHDSLFHHHITSSIFHVFTIDLDCVSCLHIGFDFAWCLDAFF